ncbi:gallate 1-beta-glucosyltransferase 84A23-like [Aegilops tauschii subsp. strangulata]|uniref:Glycosyltransferase n=1 Tax=Aegilops tauschii subsp. strangulata TaxID=200361 RepID=A0A452ZT68_AEGTS|nr:gallate 1-beta-glucosyltransferase 84A23-like [Aegilops tauschii subsp. strangulata]
MSCQEGATPAAAQPHVLLVSCPLQGHVNPLVRIGRRLAARGIHVTFTTVLRGAIHRGDGASVSAGGVRFEYHLRDDDHDNEDRAMTPDDMLRRVVDVGPAALADLVRRLADASRPVSCVVNTTFVPWALDVARELGLPCATLWNQSCAVLSLYHHFYDDDAPFPGAAEDAPVALPGLPAMSLDELPLMVRPEFAHNLWGQMLRRQLVEVRGRQAPSWVLVNTFHELERDVIEALRARDVAVTPVGPLLDDDEPAVGDDDACVMAWLDAQPPRSVVYVAFGSLVDIGRDETAALAEGLASTGRPFIWVVRDGLVHLPESVLAACRGDTGRIVAWCPQGRVLRHGAVGCFLTHCGWNSVTESLAAGVPVIAYPWWSDQFTNAKFLVEEYGVGVRLPAPVTQDALRACVDEVMSGPEAVAMRARARAWKEEAAAALADGGSSDRSLEAFVDFLRAPTRSGGVDTISSPAKQGSVSSL